MIGISRNQSCAQAAIADLPCVSQRRLSVRHERIDHAPAVEQKRFDRFVGQLLPQKGGILGDEPAADRWRQRAPGWIGRPLNQIQMAGAASGVRGPNPGQQPFERTKPALVWVALKIGVTAGNNPLND